MPSIRTILHSPSVFALAAVLVIAACTGGPAGPGATPPCGGFHLRVINQTEGRINIDINDTPAAILAPADSIILGQYLPPQRPDMPWTVLITRSTDAAKIGDAHFFAGPDRDLFVSPTGVDEKQFAPPTPVC